MREDSVKQSAICCMTAIVWPIIISRVVVRCMLHGRRAKRRHG